jgi:hypothetical protein
MRRIILIVVFALLALAAGGAGSASAEPLAPWWGLTLSTNPTVLTPAGSGEVVVEAQNRGDVATSGGVALVAVLPSKLKVLGVESKAGGNELPEPRGPISCNWKQTKVATTVTCTYGEVEYQTEEPQELVKETLRPFEQIEVRISVKAKPGASSEETLDASISGGGAARTASATRALEVGEPAPFGIEQLQLVPENFGGTIDTQAGSHPFQVTSVTKLNENGVIPGRGPVASGLTRNLVGELPVGMFGNPTPFLQCNETQFAERIEKRRSLTNNCPSDTAIGVATIQFTTPNTSYATWSTPIFNLPPRAGEPARFGFKVFGLISVFLDATLKSGGRYAVTIGSYNIEETISLLSVRLTFWGVPGSPQHNQQRGYECLSPEPELARCPTPHPVAPPPFVVMPTSCQAPFHATARADSWASFGRPEQHAEASYTLPEQVDGCNHLPFEPELRVAPDAPDASTPTGLTVDVHIPQEAALNPTGTSESTLRNTTVALPVGVAINPAGGDGLEACPEAPAGYLGRAELNPEGEPGVQTTTFSSTQPQPFCANASKIATLRITTPLLPNPLVGAVYLATQNQNPFGSLLAMYLVAKDPVSGTVIEIPGEVVLNQQNGQLVTTFRNTPELPFEDLELHFFGGERAPLSTPAHCGAYATNAVFAPWSGNEPANVSSTFNLTSGPHGAPCPGSTLPFAPALTAGTTSNQAGGFSAFTMTMSREDGNQNLSSIELHMPPGLSGTLANVKLCPEAQANEGTCPEDTLIGETVISVGLGAQPFTVSGGKVYLTEKYKGAPFGLSIVNPAKAGPFDLENTPQHHPACDCLVVRGKIEVDPLTAALTITTDPPGTPYSIPTILEGIPLEIKHVNVSIDHLEDFTFNPTNCNDLQITGTLLSTEDAADQLSVPFQVTNCAALHFKPGFVISTQGKTSRADGASLTADLTYPNVGGHNVLATGQANIAKVKVELPKQLPSRLTTLQKACTTKVFDANPAACPTASQIGHATAFTPILPEELKGPAYFVSNGSAKFPELIVVLQGYGVTVDLHGETYISPQGITSSTFATVPDVPVGTFDLTLPEGPDSALAANGHLCGTKLTMPTEFVSQDGTAIHQVTPIAVTGCPKTKKDTKRRHKRKR